MMGRPRKHDVGVSRSAAHEAALKEAGGGSLKILLTPEGKSSLERLTASTGENRSAAINRLLVEACEKGTA